MKEEHMIGQTPMTQFQSPNGEWSIFAILISGMFAVSGGMLWLFRSRESENKERLNELKKEVVDLRLEANKCHEDRLLIHGQLAELKLQMARLHGS